MKKIDGKQKNIIIDNKDYIITTKYKDRKYGDILKAVTAKLENFERIYFIKVGTKYIKVEDEKILKYLHENYEIIESDIVI